MNTEETMRRVYQQRGIVLALGAGISYDSRLPLWHELVRRLVEKRLASTTLFDELLEQDYDLSVIAGFVRTHSADDNDFAELVRECLYRDFRFKSGIRTSNRDKLINHIRKDNLTLRAIAAMCIVRGEASDRYVTTLGFQANPLVRSVINFNLDTVLREYIQARYGSPALVRTIESASKKPRIGGINMYYVHGNLRFDDKAGRADKEGARLVLTERDYFDAFNDPTSIFTYTFLYLLREYSFVFVGLSMSDTNLRRLLHYSWSERLRAFEREGQTHGRPVPHFALLIRPQSDLLRESASQTLRSLGVDVHWYRSHTELPDLFRRTYESAGQSWSDVY